MLKVEGGAKSVFICLARSQSSVPVTFSRLRMRRCEIGRQVNALLGVFLFVGLENELMRQFNVGSVRPNFRSLRSQRRSSYIIVTLLQSHSFRLNMVLDKRNTFVYTKELIGLCCMKTQTRSVVRTVV